MSANTSAPMSTEAASNGRFARAQSFVARAFAEPNPVWKRELKQSARLARTPIFLCLLTILLTLLLAAIGGIMTTRASSAQTGVALFHTFFSVAFFVVAVFGPAIAANGIASEREGRTWEALLLTGLSPHVIARGKFAASFTTVGMYVVMLAPVGAMPFLFGGITAAEVVFAFVFLFAVAALGVAFGLAVSSKLSSLRSAILLTVVLAVTFAVILFSIGGPGLSALAHARWSVVSAGPPVWLPVALARAPFGRAYVFYLLVLPTLVFALPSWLLYEVTLSNLLGESDDRSSGLKRCYLTTLAVLTLTIALPMVGSPSLRSADVGAAGMTFLSMTLFCATVVFQGDPVGPSRRVAWRFKHEGAGWVKRALGPSITGAASMLLVTGALAVFAVTAATLLATRLTATSNPAERVRILTVAAAAIALHVLSVGVAAFLRTRTASAATARLLLLGAIFLLAVAPWVAAAIVGVVGADEVSGLITASPSPFFAVVVYEELGRVDPRSPILWAGTTAAACWLACGLLLFMVARRRERRVVDERESYAAETALRLAREDEAASAESNSARAVQSEREGEA